MKTIEDLAREEYPPAGPWESYESVESAWRKGFEAGFRKAREMSLQCVLDGEFIPNDSYTKDIEENIAKLGEEEAAAADEKRPVQYHVHATCGEYMSPFGKNGWRCPRCGVEFYP